MELKEEKREDLRNYLLKMMHIRFFEEKVMELLGRNIIKGGSHLYAGEEAVAVGACAAIRPDDYITSTHRGHGHAIARGGKLPELMAEICGRKTGCCKGKGGSLHLADLSTGNLGATGIVGGNLGIATGAGLSIKMRKTDQVVLCFFGDGASNQGLFHESLNMAATWQLPVIYICENNLYGMSVALRRCSPLQDVAKRAAAYNMPSAIVDGMDVLAVKEGVEKFVQLARTGKGPSLLECKTYRYFGHSRSDPRKYRTKEEEKYWKDRDPIKNFGRRLIDNQIFTPEEIEKIEQEAIEDIEKATEFALKSPFPEVSELYEDLYV
jgi:pyruvate dehydrogenase E1 component alpha subunit